MRYVTNGLQAGSGFDQRVDLKWACTLSGCFSALKHGVNFVEIACRIHFRDDDARYRVEADRREHVLEKPFRPDCVYP